MATTAETLTFTYKGKNRKGEKLMVNCALIT